MYEDSQHANRLACLEHSYTVHNLTEQKRKLQETYEKLVVDVNSLLDAQDNLAQERKATRRVNRRRSLSLLKTTWEI